MTTRTICAAAALLLLAACSTYETTLRNPRTGDEVTCSFSGFGGTSKVIAASREAKCIDDYQAQGYVRITS